MTNNFSKDELSIICADVFDNELEVEKIEEWLSQFQKEEIYYIKILVENFQYYSLRKFKTTLRSLFRQIEKIIPHDEILSRTIVVPIGYASKSGGTVAHLFRVENALPESIFKLSSDLNLIDYSNLKNVMFIDDYIGSGNQGVHLWDYLTGIIPESVLIDLNLFYLIGVGTKPGIERMEKETRFKVIAGSIIDESANPLSQFATVFTREERDTTIGIMKKYGKLLFPSHPLGYGRKQSLVGFFYSTPNNTFPIFWASHQDWNPLLPHGDTNREPGYLLSPYAKAGIYNAQSISGINHNIEDEEMSSVLLSEFKNLRRAQIIGEALQTLCVSPSTFKQIFSSLRQLSVREHEHNTIECSLIIVTDLFDARRFPDYPLYAELEQKNQKHINIEQLAELSSAENSGVILTAGGKILGLINYNIHDNYLNGFLPSRYRKLASTSNAILGLGFYISGKNRIDIFWNGQRVLMFRETTWIEPYSKNQFDDIAAKWSQILGIKQKIINYCVSLALQMIDLGAGALIIIGDADKILDSYSDVRKHGVNFGESEIHQIPMDGVMKIVAQDGATIIDNNGIIRDFMVTIKLPTGIDITQETTKGTKHETAAKLSKITKSLCLAISVDRNFSVYINGHLEIRVNG